MSTSTYSQIKRRATPVSEPILGESMVRNTDGGGFVYEVSRLKQVERFLILGSEGGTYYAGEQKLTKDNAVNLLSAIESNGKEVVDLIVAVSDGGRALKNDPAVFALALAASAKNADTRAYALDKLSQVCRIPTHLFHFLQYVTGFRGFGRGLKRAVANWYQNQPVDKLAYQVAKYQQRDGWSNADALRLSHPKTDDPLRNLVYRYIVDGIDKAIEVGNGDARIPKGGRLLPEIIAAREQAMKTTNKKEIISLIEQFNLTHEMVPTEFKNEPDVQEALLQRMPIGAMMRNLGNYTKSGLLKPLSAASKLVVNRLHDDESLKKARVHPVALLVAMKQYGLGRGDKGSGTWTPVPAVIDALDDAFYLAFKFLEPTGKRFMFAVDVSGSMSWTASSISNLTCAEGAAAMALACAKVESDYYIMGFADEFKDLGITPRMRLSDAMKKTAGLNFGSTNCSLPLTWAAKQKIDVDCFVTITDNEVNSGIHPKQALKKYRESRVHNAKNVVMAMTPTRFSIADPTDPLSMDVSGMDASVPQALQEFAKL